MTAVRFPAGCSVGGTLGRNQNPAFDSATTRSLACEVGEPGSSTFATTHLLCITMILQFAGERMVLTVSDHIRFCNVHGRIILMDLCDGEYSILDEAATFLWDLVRLGPTFDEATTTFARKFGITSVQGHNDLMAFIDDCVSQRLLTTESERIQRAGAPESLHKPMTLLQAWLCLRRARKSLRKRGFAETYSEHMNLQFAGTQLSCDMGATMENALRVFRYAENGFAVRNADIDCLPRSLALHRFLLAGGVVVDHCIGVRRSPFGAHAWVEVSGRPIYDSSEFVEEFTLIARIPACIAS
jgi:hypothetical protein